MAQAASVAPVVWTSSTSTQTRGTRPGAQRTETALAAQARGAPAGRAGGRAAAPRARAHGTTGRPLEPPSARASSVGVVEAAQPRRAAGSRARARAPPAASSRSGRRRDVERSARPSARASAGGAAELQRVDERARGTVERQRRRRGSSSRRRRRGAVPSPSHGSARSHGSHSGAPAGAGRRRPSTGRDEQRDQSATQCGASIAPSLARACHARGHARLRRSPRVIATHSSTPVRPARRSRRHLVDARARADPAGRSCSAASTCRAGCACASADGAAGRAGLAAAGLPARARCCCSSRSSRRSTRSPSRRSRCT